ncbi:ABC transporter ATP-binding protein [Thermofilum pendens]|uniref:ABC transporter related n=1 Tax=Thermofilum pendens (strain DSM 2475 / Hrk 5) TaxID=368408 RepID=A1RZE5_THEPD|nr:ABC transporter ATP-binding protein [Thermofilum pendens]ABL78575.1 ABC transporter related [Thermofilum pendens Hrk 5]
MVRVVLENVSKTFKGGVNAVKNLNLTINDKEFMVLLGPSGCGKTTTLLMIAGVYKPTSGYIYFDDRIVNDLEPKDRNVGMVFQSYALYPHMTVYENIAFPLKLKKLPKGEIDRRVKEVASMLRIDNLLDRYPRQLSGGQQQRVALARAIAKQPDIFLMDEPLSNLDAKIRVEVRAELKRLQRELGITTIYVTHDQAEALSLADRIAVMNEGVLQQVGTPDDLYNRPANTFVAGFIGSPAANLVDADVVEAGGEYYLEMLGSRFKLPSDLAAIVKGESRVIFMVRPEDVKVVEGQGFLVYSVEWLGREALAHVRAPDGTLLRVLLPPESKLTIGAEVSVTFNYAKVHVYKPSGELIA